MKEPDILAEIRAVRDAMAARHGGDAAALAREMVERSRAAGRTLVSFPPRPPAPPRAIVSPPATDATETTPSSAVA